MNRPAFPSRSLVYFGYVYSLGLLIAAGAMTLSYDGVAFHSLHSTVKKAIALRLAPEHLTSEVTSKPLQLTRLPSSHNR